MATADFLRTEKATHVGTPAEAALRQPDCESLAAAWKSHRPNPDAAPDGVGTLEALSPTLAASAVRYTSDPLRAIDWGSRLGVSTVDFAFAPGGLEGGGLVTACWSSAQQASVRTALRSIGEVTPLRFRETTDPREAEFRLYAIRDFIEQTGFVSYMMPPGEAYAGEMGIDSDFLALRDPDSGGPIAQRGGLAFAYLMHEFGHGLGLAHPHDMGGTSLVLSGVSAPRDDYGVGRLNQGVHTTMTYNHGWPGGPDGAAYGDADHLVVEDFGHQAGMMALDIAVLQRKYGPNLGFATGDDVYRLPLGNEAGTFFTCIWDAGGTDMIRYDGARDATIDLRPATLRGEAGGGGFVSHADGVRGGFTVAAGVTIENALGGGGDDLIRGDAAGNALGGRSGDDRVYGGAGDDRLSGADGADTLRGDLGNDVLRGGLGADSLVGGAGADRLIGGGGADILRGGSGPDAFVFTAAADSSPKARDTVCDFRDNDRLDFSGFDADPTRPGRQSLVLRDDGAFTGAPGELVIDGGRIRIDVDGDRRADFVALLVASVEIEDSQLTL